jgi:transcriptional regulator of arginine metabolism
MTRATVSAPRTMSARRARIAALIATQAVASQEELGALLAADGIVVTQATLSRDLDALGAAKRSDAAGSVRYALPDVPTDTSIPTPGAMTLVARLTAELLLRAEAAGTIAVLHTPPGAAQFYAGHLDRSGAFDALGSVAGDDTVLLVLRTPALARQACRDLLAMADRGSARSDRSTTRRAGSRG